MHRMGNAVAIGTAHVLRALLHAIGKEPVNWASKAVHAGVHTSKQ
jgi:hypothetical protein